MSEPAEGDQGAAAPSEGERPPRTPLPGPLGRRLRALRSEQQLSLSELARLSGVSKGYLSLIERSDAARPSAATLFALAEALGVSVIELYEGCATPIPVVEIPDSLREFGEQADLPPTDLEMLAGIHYRGSAPETKEDWHFIYESIRRSVGAVRETANQQSETEYTSS